MIELNIQIERVNKLVEATVPAHILNVFAQSLAFFTFDVLAISKYTFKITVLVKPFSSKAWSNSGDSRQIIGLLTGERSEIRIQPRWYFCFFLNRCRIHTLNTFGGTSRYGIQQCNIVRNKLENIAVS